ncbi:MAG: hypothetical protein QOH66_1956, partial [Actinomycetota bacterium]|nr:hypothetical protein [Actinomycetota bacterium]
ISGDPLMVHPVLPGHHDAPAGNYLVGRPGHQALPAWHPSFGKQLSFSSPSRRQPSAPRFRRLGRRDPQHTSGPRTYRPRPWRISAVCGRPRSAPQASSSTRRWSRSGLDCRSQDPIDTQQRSSRPGIVRATDPVGVALDDLGSRPDPHRAGAASPHAAQRADRQITRLQLLQQGLVVAARYPDAGRPLHNLQRHHRRPSY